MAESVLYREYYRRAMQPLGDPRRREPDDALMPAFAGDDDEVTAGSSLAFKHRKLGDLLLHLLTFSVAAIKQCSQLPCCFKIGCLEKLDNMLRNVHSPGGVDSRADPKAYVIARHVGPAISDVHQRTQSKILRLWQIDQPERDDRAVLAGQLHNVGDRADGSDF